VNVVAADRAEDPTSGSDPSTPVFIPAGREDLFAIFTPAARSSNGVAVLALPGGGSDPTFGKNQVRRRLAMELADRGFSVLRINFRGVAESSGAMREVDFGDPWTEDAVAAVRWLEARGFHRIVIIGQCFGGRTAVATARHVGHLLGLALVGPPVRDVTHGEAILRRPLSWYLRRAISPRSLRLLIRSDGAKRRRQAVKAKLLRVLTGARRPRHAGASLVFVDALKAVLDARIPVLLLYGSTDDFYPDFEFVRTGPLAGTIAAAGDVVTMELVDARFGGMHSLSTQEIFVDSLVSWIDALVATDAAVTAGRP
jgi:alpha/beta superfamily hydrolase